MKRLLFIGLLFSNTIFAQVNLDKGLVAYYPFNGNVKDESNNGHDPSVTKITFTADRFGKANSAGKFNGKNTYVRIPDHPDLHFRKGFSMSAWVMINGYYEGTCHGNRIIMKGYSDDENGNYTLTFDDNYSTRGANCINRYPDKDRQSFYASLCNPVTNDYIVPGKWYLLTFTYDGKEAQLYVDCKLQAKGNTKNYIFSNEEDLFFGKLDNVQYPYWFNGLLDEVRIYNRPLTKDEIFLLCDKRSPELITGIRCTGSNIVPAKFDHIVSNCTSASFDLSVAKTSNVNTIKWSFGDGTTSTKLSPTHTYKKTGGYKVTTIVTSRSGCADTFTRQINFQPVKTDFTFSEQGMPGNIQFRAVNNNASYSWNFGDEGRTTDVSVTSHTYTATGQYPVRMFAQNSAGCRDTIEKNINVVLPTLITGVMVIEEPEETEPVQATVQMERREKDLVREIPVENDSISIALFDNGVIDGDSISLVYNNDVILTRQLLKSNPIVINLKIDRQKSNELAMYAENLGSIPPNTALMIITDGDKRHEVNVSSTKSSNGVVSFTFRQ